MSLTHRFLPVAAVAWFGIAIVKISQEETQFGVLAGLAGLSFSVAFGLRLRESRRT
jgi:hypothetical protein